MERKSAKTGAKLILAGVAALFLAASCATQGGFEAGGGGRGTQEENVLLLSRQLEGKTWVLSGILFDGEFVPMAPGHGAGNVLVFDKNGTFLTSAAALVMSGTWRLAAASSDGETPATALISMARTGLSGEKTDDPDADRFQETYLSAFEEAAVLIAYGNSFMLYDAEGKHILSFILNNPDW